MKPYYERDGVTIYHGDCLDLFSSFDADVMITDPPYGASTYCSNWPNRVIPRQIVGDNDTTLRDEVLRMWGDKPALVFGMWKAPRPSGVKAMLILDKGGACGMGDLSIPWKPSHEEIYVIGGPWDGRRDCGSVIKGRVQSISRNGRRHPHEKDHKTMLSLLGKCIDGTVIDPFCGVGPVLTAAKQVGRKAIGIEIEERYCEIAAKRLEQGVLPLGEALR